jgi:hypothetical protein
VDESKVPFYTPAAEGSVRGEQEEEEGSVEEVGEEEGEEEEEVEDKVLADDVDEAFAHDVDEASEETEMKQRTILFLTNIF